MKTFLKIVIAVCIVMSTVSLVSDPPICFPGDPCPIPTCPPSCTFVSK